MSSPYHRLVELWRSERASDRPVVIPHGFLEELRKHVIELRRQVRLAADKRSINTQLREEELRVISSLVAELFRNRMRKIVTAIMEGREPENLLDFEGEFYGRVKEVVRLYDDLVTQLSSSLSVPETRLNKTSASLVVFREGVPQLVDSEGKKHGPFNAGDLATLPRSSSDALERHGKVTRVS